MAEFNSMLFVEHNSLAVGAAATSRYVEVAPDTGHALIFAIALDESQAQA